MIGLFAHIQGRGVIWKGGEYTEQACQLVRCTCEAWRGPGTVGRSYLGGARDAAPVAPHQVQGGGASSLQGQICHSQVIQLIC